MRKAAGLMVAMCLGAGLPAWAGENEDRVVGGLISGLLGGPTQSQDATYVAQERERLIQLLSSGEYATSRQGESIDQWVLGIPLTHRDHVYSAQPAKPSQVRQR
jgi:hypothetical protein